MPFGGTVPVLQNDMAFVIDRLGVQVGRTATDSQEAPMLAQC
jgi:hypothetical protein